LNILCGLSLLLCALVIGFWIRGQFKCDWFQWHKTDPRANTWRAADMVSGRSGFYFSWQAFFFERPGHAEEYSLQLNRINGFGHMLGEPPEHALSRIILESSGIWLARKWNAKRDLGNTREPIQHALPFRRMPYSLLVFAPAVWFL